MLPNNGKTILDQLISYSYKKYLNAETDQEKLEALMEIYGDCFTQEEIKEMWGLNTTSQ